MIGPDVRYFRRVLVPFLAAAALLQVLLFARVLRTSPSFTAPQDTSLSLIVDVSNHSSTDVLRKQMVYEQVASVASQPASTNSPPTRTTRRPHPHAGARYPDGTIGYVADPTALRRGLEDFLHTTVTHGVHETGLTAETAYYWKTLLYYESDFRNSTATGKEILSPDFVCAMGPGRGFEKDGGYKLLTEKIKIRGIDDRDSQNNKTMRPRILCAIYTYPRMHDLLRTIALSWGHKCDGFLAFSTQTVSKLGLVDLIHEGEESYNNMWQKVRSIWAYLHDNYLDDYDFFHLGGDDLYVIVENFRHFLSGIMEKQSTEEEPLFLGEWHSEAMNRTAPYMVTGRPGYTLNQYALSKIVKEGFPNCATHSKVSHEDRTISNCFRDLGIVGSDTRDLNSGEQQYHGDSPNDLFILRAQSGRKATYSQKSAAYWEILEHPNTKLSNGSEPVLVGPKHGLESAATYSITLHDLYHPLYVARIHALLYKKTCPATSTLGRALRIHCIIDG